MPERYSYEYVKGYVNGITGYHLVSGVYKNVFQKLLIICPNGHEFYMRFNDFNQGHRCKYCNNERVSKRCKNSISFIKENIEKVTGYKLLSETYNGNKEKLKIICPDNHLFEMSYNSFSRGQRCPKCAINKLSDIKRHSINYIRKQISKAGYKLISEMYKNCSEKISIKCNKNHIFEMSYGNFSQGHRCPVCNKDLVTSKGEKEIANYIKSIYTGIVMENDRKQILNPNTGYNLELDIWLPELNKAIEYNGEYWHGKGSNDILKKKLCDQKGIDLLVIMENHWKKNKNYNIIKNFIEVNR